MRFVVMAALLATIAAGALAQPPAAPTVSVANAWARASAGASTTGAAYLTLTDKGLADRLVSASTPVAAMAEVHESINDHGVMRMRPAGSIALPPGTPVTLAPGGRHVMLMGLRQPLQDGDRFPLTLTFEHAAPVTVEVVVGPPGATTAPSGMAMDHGTMDHGPAAPRP